MPREKRILLIGSSLFILFILFSYLVHKDFFTQLDFNTTVRLQDNITRRVDNLFSFFSDIGKFEVMFILLILIFISIRKFIAGLVAVMLFAGLHFFELFGKFFVEHPPPPQFFLRTNNILDFPQFHVRSEYSYPSGHAGRTMFISIILILLIWRSKSLNNQIKIILISCIALFDMIMFVSRIYLGEHWTTDVMGGILLGSSLGLISSVLLIKSNMKINKK